MADLQLLSVRDLAEYLNVDMSTVYQWSQRGQIPALKVGRMWRFRRAEIDAWLDERRKPEGHRPPRDLRGSAGLGQ